MAQNKHSNTHTDSRKDTQRDAQPHTHTSKQMPDHISEKTGMNLNSRTIIGPTVI